MQPKILMGDFTLSSFQDFIILQNRTPCKTDERIDLNDFYDYIVSCCIEISVFLGINQIILSYDLYSELQNNFLIKKGFENEKI